MEKQTRLEIKGTESRQEHLVKNDYSITDQYSETANDAISNGTPLGKGDGSTGNPEIVQPGRNMGGVMHTMNTTSSDYNGGDKTIGGLYDIEGYNGTGGRKRLAGINLYNGKSQYPQSLDVSDKIKGQYIGGVKRGKLHVR